MAGEPYIRIRAYIYHIWINIIMTGSLGSGVPPEDPEYDPSTESEYECLECGTTVESRDSTTCPNCGESLRNRSLPME